jgi:hypothetical protein
MSELDRHYIDPITLALLFQDISDLLFWAKEKSMVDRDRYLQDYSLAFRGMGELPPVPREQEAIYRQMEKQERKATISLSGSGFNVMRDEYGNVVIQAGGRMQSRMLCKEEVGKEPLQNRYYRHRLFLWKRSSL